MKHGAPIEDPLELLPRGINKLYSLWRSWFYPFASIGRKVSFDSTSTVYRPRAARISIGNLVSLRAYAWLNVATEETQGDPIIVLEDNCHIGFGSIISAKNRIHLEHDVIVGRGVLFVDHNHAYEDVHLPVVNQGITEGGTIRIGHGCWIGQGACIICPRGELTIGHNCVVAANSVVMRSAPPYSVLSGNPARIIRQYDPQKNAWILGHVRSTHLDPAIDQV